MTAEIALTLTIVLVAVILFATENCAWSVFPAF